MNMDLEDNIGKYSKLNGIIRRNFGKNMRPEIQVRMHNVLSKPAMMYGSETWILKRSQNRRRTETSQMKFLRAVAEVTLRDRIRSEDAMKRLQTGNVVEDIKHQRKWLEDVERVSPERLSWQAYFYIPTGRRDIGRPKTRWKQQFQ
jgi:hypothetical protein